MNIIAKLTLMILGRNPRLLYRTNHSLSHKIKNKNHLPAIVLQRALLEKSTIPMENKKAVIREVKRKTSSKERQASRPEASDNVENLSIPVIEEHLNIEKENVETGKYQIKKTVSQENFSEDVPTIHEKVDIQRVQVNKYVDSLPEIRYEGNKTIIPVIKEVAVVEKKLMLVEEIHITKTSSEVSVNVTDKIRKEDIEISKINKI